MKIRTTFLLAVLTIALFSGCKKDDATCGCHNDPDADFLVFGKYNGMCAGEKCVEVFKIENGTLYEDSNDNYPSDSPYQASYVARSSAQYDLVKDLLSKVPAQLLDENDGLIGTPDAYDQGGFVIEIKENGVLRYWRIDTNKQAQPAYLQPFTDTLRNYIERISN